ncbi:hypothetical protein BCR36DRAFT_587497 [Piromyces finnis]|uniref:Uncharacterized protein n=1 Tax=Piromyces finnis TaxID=1754191 RepID=A0A1Y1UVL9_9FUNG|nr:hypothetical protein BCR36DRAFT_587497 [Piromyces finnis]|eukprot:ORX42105.1 hypothetical protein BCR36DRAFT_587497 [Piromyces finnis]
MVNISPVLKAERKAFIPENEGIKVNTKVCSKDLLVMGNKIENHNACKKFYNRCTTVELISIMLSYYGNSAFDSLEDAIKDGASKGAISRKCSSILIKNKIFLKDTQIIETIIDSEDTTSNTTSVESNANVDTKVCNKNLLIMGNKVKNNSACKKVYDACTTVELLSALVSFNERSEPFSMEYIIKNEVTKGAMLEKCSDILINSKMFYKNTNALQLDSTTGSSSLNKIKDINDISCEGCQDHQLQSIEKMNESENL